MHNVQNAMAAATVAYAQGIKLENIRQGLRTFDTSYFQVPGRLNVYNELPFKVILDYAHNPAAVRCMVDLVTRLDAEGKKVCVLSAPGDRRDQDIKEIAALAAAGPFDAFIVRRDDKLRGRGENEVPKILKAGLLAGGVPEENITVIADETQAMEHALRCCERGDLLLVFGDNISRCWKQIVQFKESDGQAQPVEPSNGGLSPVVALESSVGDLEGDLISDSRGVRLVREISD